MKSFLLLLILFTISNLNLNILFAQTPTVDENHSSIPANNEKSLYVIRAELLEADNSNKTYSFNLLANSSCPIISAHDLYFGIAQYIGVGYTQGGIFENVSNDNSELIIYKIRGPFGIKENDVFHLANGFSSPSIDKPIILENGSQFILPITFKAKEKKMYFDSIIISSNTCLFKNSDSVIYLNSMTSSVLEERSISNFDISPNPALNQTLLKYTLIKNDNVTILITDINGKEIQVLKNSYELIGENSFKLNLNSLPNGNYECQIKCGAQFISKKLTVLK
ncbi:MAG: T9SS type A sorting domain-containing protein [Chlorobiota bacterium]|jgi:hypothetical protein|nr:T9SS type A sorting domain-containing protein [Chlorobiota bacterium]QQS66524.1 MAG: T9SS type A sorting domain-containing protein [Chlorobiota bacterium]